MIIGISGKMHSGKDRTAHFFSALSGWKVDAFGNYLKETCSLFTGVPMEYFNDSIAKANKTVQVNGNSLTLRQYLQKMGTAIRSVDEDAFVKQLFNSNLRYKNLIIADVRLKNEAKAIEQAGGVIVRVERDFELRFKGLHVPAQDVLSHQSECDLDNHDFHFVIENNSTVGSLADEVVKIFNQIKDIENL